MDELEDSVIEMLRKTDEGTAGSEMERLRN